MLSHALRDKIRGGAVKIAWFSPLPPSTSGIAAYSAELLPALRRRHTIHAFVDPKPAPAARPSDELAYPAHDFLPAHRRSPYDLIVYQLGNAAWHDYMWGYLFRYPGLVVLHDAQLHQARALYLTQRWRPRLADYVAEFAASHPDAPEDIAHLVAAGLGGTLFSHWPLLRLVLESARTAVVHNDRLAHDLQGQYPGALIKAIPMGVPEGYGARISPDTLRIRHGIPPGAVVVAAFGGVTPEKRIPLVIDVVGELARVHPEVHLLLVGAEVQHLNVAAEARRFPVPDRVHLTGFVPDEELASYMRASDICVCLRWPTNRETSASWLRCLAAGRATVISDLVHLVDIPTLDPRSWTMLTAGGPDSNGPVAVAIDMLDERHSLQLALRRLVIDPTLRARLGTAGQAWWRAHHRLEQMVEAYMTALELACSRPSPSVALPAHLRDEGTWRAAALLTAFGPDMAVRAGLISSER